MQDEFEAPAGLRQWLLLIAPAAGAACGTIFPWGEAAAVAAGTYVRTTQSFTALWQGFGACICAVLGVCVGMVLVLARNLNTRRHLTVVSLMLATGMFGMCASYVASLPTMDPTLTIWVGGVTVYGGMGLGLFLAEALALAWLFASLSALGWRKSAPRA